MQIWPGLRLLGCVGRTKKGVVCEEEVTFEELPCAFSYEEVREMFRLSHAQTYASCQGTEFQEACTLHELNHPRFTWRHLFVGISRCRAAELVSCA